MTRAREQPRKLRKGRDRCTGHRRDGQPCGAPAIPGGLVCLKHGGSAPQVRLAAERMVLLERLRAAYVAWEAVHEDRLGQLCGKAELHAYGRIALAERELEQHDADVTLIRLLKMEFRDPSGPEVRSALLAIARDRLAGRPWKPPDPR